MQQKLDIKYLKCFSLGGSIYSGDPNIEKFQIPFKIWINYKLVGSE